MTAIAFVLTYLFSLGVSLAKAQRSPVVMTERGSSVLVWLERHPKPGTPRSRAHVARRWKARVWQGLQLAGVAWRDRHTGDVDTASPFGCLHSKEASWRDTGDPHWGGIQMDRGFMDTYGADYQRAYHGFADRWPVWAQLVAGYRAYHGYAGYGARGFGPWPNTGRACGLL